MNIKIEFPAHRNDIALAIGQALTAVGTGKALINSPAPSQAVPAPADGTTDALPVDYSQEVRGHLDATTSHPADESHYQAAPDAVEYGERVDATTGEVTQAAVGKPAGTATVSDTSTVTQTSAPATAETDAGKSATSAAATAFSAGAKPSAPAGASGRVDEKGVPFNAEFCANAAKPFYGSGKTKGQWKKRQGVEPAEYDEWYERELSLVTLDTSAEDEAADNEVETRDYAAEQRAACAFGTKAKDDRPPIPRDMGALMAWISERQTAGHLPADAVANAFATLQLPMDALLNPAHDIAGNCVKVWEVLGGGK